MTYNPYSLAGKTVLVTGASGGIGRAVAEESARMGARLVLTGRNEERLKELLATLEGEGHEIVAADLTVESDLLCLTDTLPELDGVVYCAGVSLLRPLQMLKGTDLQRVFAVNGFAPVLLLRHLLKARRLRHGGAVVLVSSVSGNGNVAVGFSAYGASKAAQTVFMEYAALELSGRDIRVNCILPGRVETELLQNGTMTADDIETDRMRYPLRRYGQPCEIAWGCIYLLSDAARWVTGTSLTIDGGLTLK